MKRPTPRGILIVALVLAAGFAVWSGFRPYAWHVDPAARCEILGTQVKKDQSFFWLDVHLKVSPDQTHDMLKPVRLATSAGRLIEPADTPLVGETNGRTDDLWFKFWLESADIAGPLTLRINDGSLSIKENAGIPALGGSNCGFFATQHW